MTLTELIANDLQLEIKETMALEIAYQRTWHTLKRCSIAVNALPALIAALKAADAMKVEAENMRLSVSVNECGYSPSITWVDSFSEKAKAYDAARAAVGEL